MVANDLKIPTRKNTAIKERDLLVLFQLYHKVSLTSSQIHKLCFIGLGKSSVYKALTRLKQLGFITAAKYDLGRLGKLEDLFFISKKGFTCLRNSGVFENEIFDHRVKDAPNLIVDYAHRIAINDYWIDLEIKFAQQSRYKLPLFVPEFKKLENGKNITLRHELENGKVFQVRNDAIFIVWDTVTDLEYLRLLEIDRGTMPIRCSNKVKEAVSNNRFIRSNLETKLKKIKQILLLGNLAFAALGERFKHFNGAKVIVWR